MLLVIPFGIVLSIKRNVREIFGTVCPTCQRNPSSYLKFYLFEHFDYAFSAFKGDV
jgi:hypothetical protein